VRGLAHDIRDAFVGPHADEDGLAAWFSFTTGHKIRMVGALWPNERRLAGARIFRYERISQMEDGARGKLLSGRQDRSHRMCCCRSSAPATRDDHEHLSALVFGPMAVTPTDRATKAAIHSHTQLLRYQQRLTTIFFCMRR
jgi:hypothetical protein